MKLGALSLLANETFVKDAIKDGPLSLRIKYATPDTSEAIELAKSLSILIGLNAQKPLVDEDLTTRAALKALCTENDYIALAALAVIAQNKSMRMLPAIKHLTESPMAYKETIFIKKRSILNPIVFEYLFRAVGNYTPDQKKIDSMVSAIAMSVESNNPTLKVDGYRLLNKEAGFADYTNDKEINAVLSHCVVFNSLWSKRNKT